MPLKIKILIIVAVIIAVLAVVFGLFRDVKNTETPNQAEPEPVVDILTAEQRQSAKKFVKNFLSLYNTYEYDDYSNLSALGDYQTQNAQKQTLDRIDRLAKETPPGFEKITELDEADIEIGSLLLRPDKIEAKAKFFVTEIIKKSLEFTPRSDDSAEVKRYEARATLMLVPYNSSWLVDDVELK